MRAAHLHQIREGNVAAAPASIKEVAAHAGVSVGTVSNVLNRPDIVAEPTRSRVRDAIKQLGFIRNESARQLRAGRSRTIGLVVLDVANPFFTDVARGVEDEASEAGLAVSHLLDEGHEQIAFVGGPLSIRQVADRHEGAVRALQRAGRSQDDLHMFETPALNVAAGQRAGAELAGLPAATR